jgi:hypothetical protein
VSFVLNLNQDHLEPGKLGSPANRECGGFVAEALIHKQGAAGFIRDQGEDLPRGNHQNNLLLDRLGIRRNVAF